MKIVSACFLGVRCRSHGRIWKTKKIIDLAKKEVLIPVCPEQLGGLKTPRPGCGISGGDGNDVISGKAKVLNRRGEDLTENFIRGAEEALKIAKLYNIKEAIFKQGSPSCGNGLVFQWKKVNGKWRNRRRKGDGVATALLKRNGIKVLNERNIRG